MCRSITSQKLRTSSVPFLCRSRIKSLSSTSLGDPLLNSPIWHMEKTNFYFINHLMQEISPFGEKSSIEERRNCNPWKGFGISVEKRNLSQTDTNTWCRAKHKTHSPRHVCKFASEMWTAVEYLEPIWEMKNLMKITEENNVKITNNRKYIYLKENIQLQWCS